MKDDTREELQRLEKELLSEDDTPAVTDETVFFDPIAVETPEGGEPKAPNLLDETMVVPAFDDPDMIHEPDEPMVYRNFSNDYGQDLHEPAAPAKQTTSRDDKITMGLMITASGLCLGIIGILTYWLAAYL